MSKDKAKCGVCEKRYSPSNKHDGVLRELFCSDKCFKKYISDGKQVDDLLNRLSHEQKLFLYEAMFYNKDLYCKFEHKLH